MRVRSSPTRLHSPPPGQRNATNLKVPKESKSQSASFVASLIFYSRAWAGREANLLEAGRVTDVFGHNVLPFFFGRATSDNSKNDGAPQAETPRNTDQYCCFIVCRREKTKQQQTNSFMGLGTLHPPH